MEPWLIYGGTFDPVHLGHLAIARNGRDVLRAPVHLMPAADPPHRAPPGASAAHRARMLDIAVEGEPGMAVDRRELEREGRSWSVDTLRGLRDEIGGRRPVVLLLGADSFLGLPGWKEWQALFELAHFMVAERPGTRLDGALPETLRAALAGRWADSVEALRASPAGRVLRLDQPLHPHSASAIRRAIAQGGPWEAQVPAGVAAYIRRHRLYGAEAEPASGASPGASSQQV
ncbi:nicotinate-nucleotide adenylyltransferase [Marilutibacter aestuarii]|uniref:Probable nicotinate-nucleotide adenylyltransferase n=1 Tax=Marilutibacter aestuarii TaxID=1706195 RepID=A0A508A6J6_9GAMM|nr:nicotinate-nucleotide adenylyltransferase [Lysobacter aestuarii]TQD43498.1 nicotinate-nucleotide adenylyltransferase [Lysobacter aestuarii]